jgi:hypothetical protein
LNYNLAGKRTQDAQSIDFRIVILRPERATTPSPGKQSSGGGGDGGGGDGGSVQYTMY